MEVVGAMSVKGGTGPPLKRENNPRLPAVSSVSTPLLSCPSYSVPAFSPRLPLN